MMVKLIIVFVDFFEVKGVIILLVMFIVDVKDDEYIVVVFF